MSSPNPFQAPNVDGPAPRALLVSRAFWPVLALGGLLLALDLGGWYGSIALGTVGIVVRFALLFGGLTALPLAVVYAVIPGRRADAVAFLVVGSGVVAFSIASWAPLFLLYPG